MSRCSAATAAASPMPQAAQRIAARRRGARRHRLSDRPRHDRQGARLRPPDAQLARRRLRPRLRARVAGGRRDLRHAPLALRRGDRDLGDAAVRLRAALRPLHHRLLDHAAEAQPRRGRAGARQDRPHHRRADRPADRHEGPAARLFEGHAGGQGAGLRRAAEPVALARRDDRHGRAT